MISLNKDLPVVTVRPGLGTRKPIHDPSCLKVGEWIIEPGTQFEPHSHDYDQVTYIIKGKLRIKEAGIEYLLEPGCYYYNPEGEVIEVLEIIEQTTMLVVSSVNK